jgi:hypothetical protein
MVPRDGALVERRDPVRRAAFVKVVVRSLVQSATAEFTIEEVQRRLSVSPEIAARVLSRLVSAGVLEQTRRDLWVKVNMSRALPDDRRRGRS